MKERMARETLEIPENVEVEVKDGRVSVKGPLGMLQRDFSHAAIDIRREDGRLAVEASWPDKKRAALVGTVRSHINNMITGVTKGFTYKLMIVYAHFPMSVRVQGGEVVVENFHGERSPRKARVQGDVKVAVEGDEVIVKGLDVADVSQTAANIQQATRIKKKDPRIFLDGIYVFEKGEGM